MLYGGTIVNKTYDNVNGLNPYFFGKCSTAGDILELDSVDTSLNPYFFGKCSTAHTAGLNSGDILES